MKKKSQKCIAKILVVTLCIGSLFSIQECNSYAKSKKPKLSTKKLVMQVGAKKKIKIKNANGAKVTWKTNKKSIASVKKAGKYNAIIRAKRQGTTSIKASVKFGSKKTSVYCKVIVQKKKDENKKPATTASNTTAQPSGPVNHPTISPTQQPTVEPIVKPSMNPTINPTPNQTDLPTSTPTILPTATPTQTPIPTPVPTDTKLTMSPQTLLGSTSKGSNLVYNADGSVTVHLTLRYGGIAFFLDKDKVSKKLDDYTKVIFDVTAEGAGEIEANYYTESTGYWDGKVGMTYPKFNSDRRIISCDLAPLGELYGFGLQYNSEFNEGDTFTFTIHSITLRRDIRDISDAMSFDSLYQIAEQYGFKMGTVMSPNTIADTKYATLVAKHFNSITGSNEMKAYSLLQQKPSAAEYVDENSMPVLDFTKADIDMEYAIKNHMAVRGHTLVWDAHMCDWLFRVGYDTKNDYATEDVVKKRVKNYIERVLTYFETKYPGQIYCWDVVNEAVLCDKKLIADDDRAIENNIFSQRMGKDYVELSFQYAYDCLKQLGREKDVKLYYNDFSTFYDEKRNAICNLVDSINHFKKDESGNYVKLCSGVGMQSYIGGYGKQSGCMNKDDLTRIKTSIQAFASHGVEVQATELAVRNYVNTDEIRAQQADFYRDLIQIYIDINKENPDRPVKAVSIWGLTDNTDMNGDNMTDTSQMDQSFLINSPYCGLFDVTLGVKECFISIFNLMSNTEINE